MATATSEAIGTQDPWAMEVKTAGSGDFEICPAGNYPGTIIAIIDAGFHEAQDPKTGRPYERRILLVGYELAKKKKDGSPFTLAERYTWSMSNNSNFYTLAVNLTGPKKEGERFDPRVLAGMPVMVQVTNSSVTKNGKENTYFNVGAVAQFPEGLPVPAPTRDKLVWSVMEDKPKPDTSWLPYIYGEPVNKIIDDSAEAKAGRIPKATVTAADFTSASSDIPF